MHPLEDPDLEDLGDLGDLEDQGDQADPDLVAGPDLVVGPDLVAGPDLAAGSDLPVGPDLPVGLDLAHLGPAPDQQPLIGCPRALQTGPLDPLIILWEPLCLGRPRVVLETYNHF